MTTRHNRKWMSFTPNCNAGSKLCLEWQRWVSLPTFPIVGQNGGRLMTAEGHVRSAGEGFLIASTYLVQGNYFQSLHIPLIRGRYFESHEMSRPVLHWWRSSVESFAGQYFHGKDPIGLRMKVGDRFDSPMPAITVVGVVGDVKQGALDQPTSNQMYEPVSQAAAALGPMAAMLGLSAIWTSSSARRKIRRY